MLNKFFPDNLYKTILDRKRRIVEIKQYKAENNNKFPKDNLSCFRKLENILFDIPNPNKFDYDYQLYPFYTYHDFAKLLIRKYDNKFENYRINFRMKHLQCKTKYKIIDEIDEMYVNFNSYGLKNNNSRISKMSDYSSRSSARESYHSTGRSILRNSSHRRKTTLKSINHTISDFIVVSNVIAKTPTADENVVNFPSE